MWLITDLVQIFELFYLFTLFVRGKLLRDAPHLTTSDNCIYFSLNCRDFYFKRTVLEWIAEETDRNNDETSMCYEPLISLHDSIVK